MRWTRKLTACFVICLLAAGCSTRTVSLKSLPSGAQVTVNGRSCTTPCTMPVPSGEQVAVFVHPSSKAQKTVPFSTGVAAGSHLLYEASVDSSRMLKGASIPFLAFGAFSLSIFADIEENALDEDTDEGRDLYLASLGSLVAGAILYGLGEAMSDVAPPDEVVEVEAVFGDEAPVPGYVPISQRKIGDFVEEKNPLLMPQELRPAQGEAVERKTGH